VALSVPVLARPVIVTQPRDQAVPYGGTTTLFVRAQGPGPIDYQWFLNSTNAIAHATNATLVISNAAATNEGDYQARLTQAGEVTWSESARLAVFAV
ncbi:immunoglobulin domain-containing protein, partial [Clostridium perfringens]|nr:immunoglobulin domain-containing protein [Clostridium perfringens]